MSVSIRLTQTGKKGERKFRIIAVTTRSKNRGKAIEVLGFVDKTNKIKNINKERLSYWRGNGAIVSKSLEKVLAS